MEPKRFDRGEDNQTLDSTPGSVQDSNRPFNLFKKVNGAMHKVPDVGETFKAIIDAVIDEIPAENCSLMLKDPVSGELSIRAARGKDEGRTIFYSHPGNGRRFKPGEGIAGWVLKENQAVIVNDVKEEPRFVRAAGLDDKVRSLVCFPIEEKGQVVGVFNISHSKRRAFGEADKLALGYVANQVGAALTSARFFLEIQEMNRLMKDSTALPTGASSKDDAANSSTFVEVGELTSQNGMFIYSSDKMHRIKEVIDQVANTDVTVFIQGESGVGKEVVARSIHQNSLRKDKPFIKVNCAALPSELLESELFGYEKGAFTGAYRQKLGKFELADGGTIFLDEILEMSLSLQAKLLQVLQDREFSRLGGKKDVRVDVRVLAASNKNVEKCVQSGNFREDLYYRLNVVNIILPPLRERKEEIPIFVEYFLEKYGKKYRKGIKHLSDRTMKILLDHQWSGNVRELENVIQRLVVLGNEESMIEELTPAIRQEFVPPVRERTPGKTTWPSLREVHRDAIVKAESEVIRRALELTNWNRKKAADMLNISYKALLYKIKECGIDKKSESFFVLPSSEYSPS